MSKYQILIIQHSADTQNVNNSYVSLLRQHRNILKVIFQACYSNITQYLYIQCCDLSPPYISLFILDHGTSEAAGATDVAEQLWVQLVCLAVRLDLH